MKPSTKQPDQLNPQGRALFNRLVKQINDNAINRELLSTFCHQNQIYWMAAEDINKNGIFSKTGGLATAVTIQKIAAGIMSVIAKQIQLKEKEPVEQPATVNPIDAFFKI